MTEELTQNMGSSIALEPSQFLLYTTENGKVKVNVVLKDETIWLTANGMAVLCATTKQNISTFTQYL